MKFFLAFLQSEKNHPIPAYSFWQYYIKNGITEAGHEWAECPEVDWAFGLVPQTKSEHSKWKTNAWSKTIDWLKKNPVDVFLSYLYPGQIDISAIKEIKKTGIPCVNFFCDNIREFTTIPTEFAEFDLNWVPEYEAVGLYKKAGYKYINLPMPMWVERANRFVQPEKNNEVTFIGSKEIQRQLFFERVVSENPALPLSIYGTGWTENSTAEVSAATGYSLNERVLFQLNFLKQQGLKAYLRKLTQRGHTENLSLLLQSKTHGPISFEEYCGLTAASMVTVGLNRYTSYRFPLNKPGTYSRLRDIEAPMLGACYLTEFTAGLEELYDIGTEIMTFKTTGDFIEKVKILQSDKNLRERLKINAQKKALSNHSIPNSLKKIICALNL